MKLLDIPASGKRGKTVAFKSRFGQCEREHTRPTQDPTAAQRHSQSAFGTASLGWNYLTDEQRDAWRAYAKKVRSHPRGGQSGPLTGQMLFTAINRNQALLSLPPFLNPPERPVFGPNPVTALSITQGHRGIALKLDVATAPTGHILDILRAKGGRIVLSLELFTRRFWEMDPAEVAKTGFQKLKTVADRAQGR